MTRHGWIERRIGPKGLTLRVRYWVTDDTGAQVAHSKSFTERAYGSRRKAEEAAKAFLAKVVTDQGEGTFITPSELTLAQLIDQWIGIKSASVRPTTIHSYRIAANRIPPQLGSTPIQRLKPLHIQQFYRDLRERGLGEGTLLMVHVVILGSLKQAVRWEILTRNPASAVESPRPNPPSLHYWTPAECASFIAIEGDHPECGLLWRLLIGTGVRLGEALALTWGDIDLQRGTLRISRTMTADLDGRMIVGTDTKSRHGRRTIPLSAELRDRLRDHRSVSRFRGEDVGDDAPVITRNGERMDAGFVRREFAKANMRCGLPKLTPHGLRHSFATALMLAGVHPRVAADLLGDTPAMVLKVYSHVTQDAQQSAIDAIAAAFTIVPNTTTGASKTGSTPE